jgi:hypothetical protein
MKTRTYVAALVSMMINAVVFGIGAIAVLSLPGLAADAWFWLPLVVVVSFVVSPFIGWWMAPMLRARYERRRGPPSHPSMSRTA